MSQHAWTNKKNHEGYSQIINVTRLERETRRWFYLGILLAVLFHGIMAVVWKQKHSITVESKSRPVVRLKLYSIPPQDMYMMQRKHPAPPKQYERHRISIDKKITSPEHTPLKTSTPLFELNIRDRDL